MNAYRMRAGRRRRGRLPNGAASAAQLFLGRWRETKRARETAGLTGLMHCGGKERGRPLAGVPQMFSRRRSSRTRSRLMGSTESVPRTRRAKPLPVHGKMLSI